MNILLICSGGMSTHILMSSLEKEAKQLGIEFTANAIGVAELDEYARNDYDVILVAPQIRFKFAEFEKIAQAKRKLIYQIQPTEYNPVGVPRLLKNVKKLMEENNVN
ncbi:Lichenan-specific phosphotransferase enzyme IIB component [Mycoplasmopsis californica]|uniref:PTS sugar transporter subunit IIB n=1 Tax=Mycoplasmopsis equigenitalium TaxID=114883 RepID=A0ABY5J0B3_9BACT|nr:PTS sugar transporter subunit IIB [Mycoplasmopsis equigenitalium]UUD36664.1 PTS sugar transporter subunit IIB [Mycoplasmopsis equigenitalium]VEU69374.1 Lichenan-specific phosphotransferase enzyme IIB component [Mycoplasmopsis californica]